MKTKVTIFLCFLLTSFIFSSCHDDDDYKPNDIVLNAFKTDFPDARKVDWKKTSEFDVADFIYQNINTEAWYTSAGNLMMKITEMTFSQLPLAIQETFNNSMYKDWIKDDIEKIERVGESVIYRMDVENDTKNKEVTLYFNENGNMLLIVDDKDHDSEVTYPLPTKIKQYIETEYPNAIFTDIDLEKGLWEVDIWDNGLDRELVFDSKYDWVETHYYVDYTTLPIDVKNKLIAEGYTDPLMMEIDKYETATNGEYYQIEIELNDETIKTLKIRADGTLIQ